MAKTITTVEQAKAAGAEMGREAVTCFVNENGGVEALFDVTGAWDEPAINAGAHTSAGIKDEDAENYEELRAAFYEAYDAAARAYEAELLAESEVA